MGFLLRIWWSFGEGVFSVEDGFSIDGGILVTGRLEVNEGVGCVVVEGGVFVLSMEFGLGSVGLGFLFCF